MKPPVRTRSSRLTPTNELSSDQFPDATPTASRLAQWAKELRKAYPNAGAWSDYNQVRHHTTNTTTPADVVSRQLIV